MRRTLRLSVLVIAACALSGCVSSKISSSQQRSTNARSGDKLGYAVFANRNSQSRLARAEAP